MTNTPGYNHFHTQLKDLETGMVISKSGGACYVAKAGLPDKETLTDKFGTALTNPLQLTSGAIDFCVPITSLTVDLYIQTPGGHFLVIKSIGPSGLNEYTSPSVVRRQMMIIPFSIADTTATVETDTGFVVPDPSLILDRLHGMAIQVTAADSAKTIDVGTAEANGAGGDADTFNAAASLTNLGLLVGTNGDAFSSNAPATSTALIAGNKKIVYTLSTGATTAKGFIYQPYQLGN